MNKKPLLGIFDSGVGGFSVLKEIRKVTDADILYYGDCKNAPYGNRSQQEIIAFIKAILKHLKKQGVTHFVSACNSMSVNTTDEILKQIGIPRDRYIDMIDGVSSIDFMDGANVLIVGTQATIDSRVYQSILSKKIIAHHIFVPTTLAGEIESSSTALIAKSVTSVITYAKKVKATHILYACTHYPLVDDTFKQKAAEKGWVGMFVNPSLYVGDFVTKWNIPGSKLVIYEASLVTDSFKKFTLQ